MWEEIVEAIILFWPANEDRKKKKLNKEYGKVGKKGLK